MIEALQLLSVWTIPVAVALLPLIGYVRGVRVYEAFCEGAKEGFHTAVAILPYLVAMFVAIGIFRASGAFEMIIGHVSWVTELVGAPPEVLPLALLRPLSGSGALGYLSDLLKEHGPDSLIGLIASTMQGSTETTFYVLTVYFGAVGVTRARHSVAVGLLADLVGFVASIYVVLRVFSGG